MQRHIPEAEQNTENTHCGAVLYTCVNNPSFLHSFCIKQRGKIDISRD